MKNSVAWTGVLGLRLIFYIGSFKRTKRSSQHAFPQRAALEKPRTKFGMKVRSVCGLVTVPLLGFCRGVVQFARVEDGVAIGIASHGLQVAGLGDDVPIWICSQGHLSIASCRIVSCHVMSRRVISCRLVLYYVASFDVMSSRVASFVVTSSRVAPRRIASCLPCPAVSHPMLRLVVSYRLILVKRRAATLSPNALLRFTQLTLIPPLVSSCQDYLTISGMYQIYLRCFHLDLTIKFQI